MPSELRRRAGRAALVALLLTGPSPAAGSEPPRLLERVLAEVDGAPVLHSDVSLLASLNGLSEERALEAAIDERLMFQQAIRLTQAALTPEQEQAALASLLSRPEAARWPESALRRLARRQATILKYVEFRFRAQLRVDEAAVRELYEREWAGSPEAPSFESAQAALRERLLRQALDERVEGWVRELRESADIRRNP